MPKLDVDPRYVPEDAIQLTPTIVIFDRKNPRSLINIVWEELRDSMLALEANHQDLLQLTERKLEKLLEPDPTESRLRLRFWDEYSRAQEKGKRMLLAEVCRGVCSGDFWEKNILRDLKRVAYIINPPTNYIVTMEELLYKGLDRVREVLDLPIKDAKGRPDARLISEMVKIVQMLDQRVKGAIIQKVAIQQKIEQKTQHSFQSGGAQDPLLNASPENLQMIEAQLGRLNSKLERIQALPPGKAEFDILDLPPPVAIEEPKVEEEIYEVKKSEAVDEQQRGRREQQQQEVTEGPYVYDDYGCIDARPEFSPAEAAEVSGTPPQAEET
jgi:hypothetical protein